MAEAVADRVEDAPKEEAGGAGPVFHCVGYSGTRKGRCGMEVDAPGERCAHHPPSTDPDGWPVRLVAEDRVAARAAWERGALDVPAWRGPGAAGPEANTPDVDRANDRPDGRPRLSVRVTAPDDPVAGAGGEEIGPAPGPAAEVEGMASLADVLRDIGASDGGEEADPAPEGAGFDMGGPVPELTAAVVVSGGTYEASDLADLIPALTEDFCEARYGRPLSRGKVETLARGLLPLVNEFAAKVDPNNPWGAAAGAVVAVFGPLEMLRAMAGPPPGMARPNAEPDAAAADGDAAASVGDNYGMEF